MAMVSGCEVRRRGGVSRAVVLAVLLALLGASSARANTVLHVDAVNGTDSGNCQTSPAPGSSGQPGRQR